MAVLELPSLPADRRLSRQAHQPPPPPAIDHELGLEQDETGPIFFGHFDEPVPNTNTRSSS